MQKQLSIHENKLPTQILKICHSLELPLHYNHKGLKVFTNYQRIALIILYKRSGKSLVDFISELHESRWPRWLGLKEIPAKSALHSWLQMFEMPIIRAFLSEVLRQTTTKPWLMAIDGTGIDSWQRCRHYDKRLNQCGVKDRPMPYAKLDVVVDTETMLIYDHVLRIIPRHDALVAKHIARRTNQRGIKMLGDKGYDSEPLHEMFETKGIKLYAPVRKSEKKKPRGFFRTRCSHGDKDYYRRNTVESAFHALKQRFLPCLRARRHYMKKREMAWTILLFNMTRINEQMRILLRILTSILDGPKTKAQ